MDDENLYQPPAAVPPPFAYQPVASQMPQSIKVFGILHLLGAGYGVLMTIWTVIANSAWNPFLKFVPAGPQRDIQVKMMKAIEPMTYVNAGITLAITLLITIAGVKLLKGAKNAVKASNLYAIFSLLGKVVGAVLLFTYMMPAQRAVIEEQLGSLGDLPGNTEAIMEGSMIAGGVIGILFSCIYPTLCLILLNRRSVKEWLAQFGR